MKYHVEVTLQIRAEMYERIEFLCRGDEAPEDKIHWLIEEGVSVEESRLESMALLAQELAAEDDIPF